MARKRIKIRRMSTKPPGEPALYRPTRPAAFAQIKRMAVGLQADDLRFKRDVVIVQQDGSMVFHRSAFLAEWFQYILLFTEHQGYHVFAKEDLRHYAQYTAMKIPNVEQLMSAEKRCKHGMFFSGAGACPQCGKGAE